MATVILDACALIAYLRDESGSEKVEQFRIAYADAFALALTQKESEVLATTDHKELDPVSAGGQVQFLWLR